MLFKLKFEELNFREARHSAADVESVINIEDNSGITRIIRIASHGLAE